MESDPAAVQYLFCSLKYGQFPVADEPAERSLSSLFILADGLLISHFQSGKMEVIDLLLRHILIAERDHFAQKVVIDVVTVDQIVMITDGYDPAEYDQYHRS